jgi:hypothetical protein
VPADRLTIAEVVQDWAIGRDTGDWQRLRAAFHPDGTMTATWFSGPADAFVAASKAQWEKGSRVAHVLGGTSVRLNGGKAIAETRLILAIRAPLDGEEVDVTCYGRFYDRMAKHEGGWGILRRNVVYEKDRIDAVRPGAVLQLDEALLRRFPEGYRHIAYVQTRAGMTVDPALATPHSAALKKLTDEAEAWLAA